MIHVNWADIYGSIIEKVAAYRHFPFFSVKGAPMTYFEPMLAAPNDPKKLAKMAPGNVLIAPKLDGIRCVGFHIVSNGQVVASRFSARNLTVDGVPSDLTPNIPHLVRAFKMASGSELPAAGDWIAVTDGELVAPSNATSSSKVVRITGCLPEVALERQLADGFLRYMVFDAPFIVEIERGWRFDRPIILQPPGSTVPLHQRRAFLKRFCGGFARHVSVEQGLPMSGAAPQHLEQAVGLACAAELAKGGEGVMVKCLDSPYIMGARSAKWLKVKGEATSDLVVAGVVAAKDVSEKVDGKISATKFAGMAGALVIASIHRPGKVSLEQWEKAWKAFCRQNPPMSPLAGHASSVQGNGDAATLATAEGMSGDQPGALLLMPRGTISGMTDEERADVTKTVKAGRLEPYVVEVKFNGLSETKQALRHPRFVCRRPDKRVREADVTAWEGAL